MVTSQIINGWLMCSGEHERLEFKEAKTGHDSETTHKLCVAIANEGGGHVVFGITDSVPRVVVGTNVAENRVQFTEQLYRVLGFRVEVEVIAMPEGRVVVLTIPPRPDGAAYEYKGAYYMRSGASLVTMGPDRLRQLLTETAELWLDGTAVAGLSPSDVLELLNVEVYLQLVGLSRDTLLELALSHLEGDHLIGKTGSGEYFVRRIGAVLLARNMSSFPIEIARKSPRVIVYNGTDKLSTKLERMLPGGYAVELRALVRFVGEQLPQNEVIQDALRVNIPLVPDDAVRELLANALIHQDFSIAGTSPLVEVYDNRVEISNPGTPVIAVDRFIDSFRSRNERLASVMRKFGFCEEKSSGVDRVLVAIEAFQLPAPKFSATGERTCVTVYGPKPFPHLDRAGRIRACYQHCALRFVMGQRMTNQSLRARFGLPDSKNVAVSLVISAAVEDGLVRLDEGVGGSRKYARYVPYWA